MRWDHDNLASMFHNITEITCDLRKHRHILVSHQIWFLLDGLKKLRLLCIDVDGKISMNKKCFQAIATSRLTTLIISTDVAHQANITDIPIAFLLFNECSYLENRTKYATIFADFEPSSVKSSLKPNCTLKNARVCIEGDYLLLLFSKYFLCLDGLIVHQVGNNILRSIAKYQSKLRCLKLYCDSRDELPIESSVHQFNEVKYLSLDICKSQNGLIYWPKRCVFPKLKSLSITSDIKIRMQAIANLPFISTFEQLDHLELNCAGDNICFWDWLVLFEALAKMKVRYIHILARRLFDDRHYRQLFDVCPSLCILVHKSDTYGVKCTKNMNGINVTKSVPYQLLYKGLPKY